MADEKDAERRKAINDSYSKAGQALIGVHKDEFNALRRKILGDAGIDWSPPLTREQRDEAQLAEILARNPGLAEKVVSEADGVKAVSAKG